MKTGHTKTIHIVGAQESNYPWGFENRLIPAFKLLGCNIISTDYRKERNKLPHLLRQKADLVLVCKGEGIAPYLIETAPCVTALWYAEQIGTIEYWDESALLRRKELKFNAGSFDYVFSHDQANLDIYYRMGARRVEWLPTAAIDPNVQKKLHLPKQYDVVFIGSMTGRRQKIISELSSLGIEVYTPKIWDPVGMNQIFNQARIVLNLHLSDLPNTETRLAEALGAGTFLLSEPISSPDFLKDGVHYVECKTGDVKDLAEKIDYFLSHEKEREEIAHRGYAFVRENHTYVKRAETLLKKIDFSINQRIWPSLALGVMRDAQGVLTLRCDKFYEAVRDSLKKQETKITHCNGQPLRIFAAFANVNWESSNLLPALQEFGEVIHYTWNFNDQYRAGWHAAGKRILNQRLLEAVQRAHKERPLDIFFGYLSGRIIFPETVRAIRKLGIPTLNLSLDDRMKFFGELEETGFTGMADIAAEFDLCWTSTQEAVKYYQSVGANVIYLPEGANPLIYKPLDIPFDIDVSFVGQCYGQRPKFIEYLRSNGINVQTFGKGWEAGEVTVDDMVKIYNRSRINLGFSMVGNFQDVFCLKGRDFEIPMSGALYLTQYHQELENVYQIGKEIYCYYNLQDLVDKIHYLLGNPDKADEVRKAGYQRATTEHTWVQRFRKAFEEMAIFKV